MRWGMDSLRYEWDNIISCNNYIYRDFDIEIHGDHSPGVSIKTHNFVHILNNSKNKKGLSKITKQLDKKAMNEKELLQRKIKKMSKKENRELNRYIKNY